MLDIRTIRNQITLNGFVVIHEALSDAEVHQLATAVEKRGCSERAGVRNVFREFPIVQKLPGHPMIGSLVRGILNCDAFAVRALFFDKAPGANWKVTWHQDLTIAVRERRDTPGYAAWSNKAGIPHVQPPAAVLEHMLAVRVHLDSCGPGNGPLMVLPGSHRFGRLDPRSIDAWRTRVRAEPCHVPAGGIVAMRPLLLHASSEALDPTHRRVMHLEFAAADLASGLEWHERWYGTAA